jgi:hypothetical protein
MKKKEKKNKKASVLIVSLLILGAVITIALSLALVAVRERKTAMSSSRSQVAYQMADQGVEMLMNALLKVNVGVASRTDVYRVPEGDYADGILTIKSVMEGRFTSKSLSSSCSPSSLIACCITGAGDTNKGKIVSPDGGKSFIVSLGTGDTVPDPTTFDCDDSSTDISEIENIKSVGYDLNSQTSRAIQALVETKEKYVKLFLDMESTSTTEPQDISRMHNTVKSNSPSFSYSSDIPHGYGYRSLKFDSSNSGYFEVNSTSNKNLSKDLTFKYDNNTDKDSANFTVDFWFKSDHTFNGSEYQSIFTIKEDGASPKSINLAIYRGIGNAYGVFLSTLNFSDSPNLQASFQHDDIINGFHHIALVREHDNNKADGKLTVYIDGQNVTASGTNCSGNSCTFNASEFLGKEIYLGGLSTYCNPPVGSTKINSSQGYIDQFRISRTALWSDPSSFITNGHTLDIFTKLDMEEFYE